MNSRMAAREFRPSSSATHRGRHLRILSGPLGPSHAVIRDRVRRSRPFTSTVPTTALELKHPPTTLLPAIPVDILRWGVPVSSSSRAHTPFEKCWSLRVSAPHYPPPTTHHSGIDEGKAYSELATFHPRHLLAEYFLSLNTTLYSVLYILVIALVAFFYISSMTNFSCVWACNDAEGTLLRPVVSCLVPRPSRHLYICLAEPATCCLPHHNRYDFM